MQEKIRKQKMLGQIPKKQKNCCTPIGQIKRYKDCIGCDRKPKQETLEEAADRYFPFAEKIGGETYTAYRGFMAGAKWQQEIMYSEKEVIKILDNREDYLGTEPSILDYLTNKEWFEQFKNK